MSTALIPPAETTQEAPAFDPAAYAKARQEGKPIERPSVEAKTEPPKTEEAKPAKHDSRRSEIRSLRQQLHRALENVGAEKARREMLEAGGSKPEPKAEEDPEPKRADYASEGEYIRAATKWDNKQLQKQAAAAKAEEGGTEEFRAHLKAMDEKAVEDIKLIPDWDAVSKAAAEDEDAPEFIPTEHPQLMAMMAQSDVKAFVLHYFAKNSEAFQSMLDLTAKPGEQIRAFHRLEGRLEREYANVQAAQAPDAKKPEKVEQKEDRKHLAEAARPGETAADRDVRKPKPSAEVAARGGSAAPDEPAIGSPAWVAKRLQARHGR